MVDCSVSTNVAGQELFLRRKVVIYPQRIEGLCCDALVETCKGLQTADISATDTSSTIGYAGSNGPSDRGSFQQPGPVAEPSLVLGPAQN